MNHLFIMQISYINKIIHSVYYIMNVYMHLPYITSSYTLHAYDPLTVYLYWLSFPLFNDMQSIPTLL